MSTVLVISGSDSPERAVSLRSGEAVAAALTAAGHTVKRFDPSDGHLADAIRGCDVVFPVLHGKGGEDGSIQAELEALQVPYVGSGVASSKLCFDKVEFKRTLQQNSLPTAESAVVAAGQDLASHPLATRPFVLKPYDGGSSIDTFIIRDPSVADFDAMASAIERYGSMLLESLVEGVEITVAVVGDKALPVIEIIPPESGEFDYENKYNGATQELCPPQHVSEAVQREASTLAEQIHALCGCRDMSRTDMIVAADGSLTVLETNTIPGLTDQSLLPKAGAAAGLAMTELCDKLVQMALSRRTERA